MLSGFNNDKSKCYYLSITWIILVLIKTMMMLID